MRPQIPTASDLAILAGAIWESRPVRVVSAFALMLPTIGFIFGLAAVAAIEDEFCGTGGRW